MSDFVPRDMLPDLWEEILKRHWSFLETEESIQKLEERKKLECCLKEFLCIVPHDRKFFLPETAHVLKKSIREMDDFTAYKAIIGFDSISQYANNLFTKPWRKEFRVLKMYSGFYQHEVKSNLVEAEKLFEAMGYRRLSDEILILDGPICPDQVTNVSRDAMAAYVECQIMKNIYAGLVALGLTCSWQDVFHYREKYVGGASQAIKGLAYAIQERRLRKEKLGNADHCYTSIQHSPQLSGMASSCQNCVPYHMTQSQHGVQPQLLNGQCPLHHNPTNNNCGLHPAGKLVCSYPTATGGYQQHQYAGGAIQPHMSHSRSLEHYNEPPVPHLPHRHSFDHQQQGCTAAGMHHYQQPHAQHVYESPYDCLDGVSMGSSASYAAVGGLGGNCNLNVAYAHPYNVSGNRYPLPFNISNQLTASSHYAKPSISCNGIKGDPYTNVDSGGYATVSKPMYACNYHAQAPLAPVARHNSASAVAGPPSTKDLQHLRPQRSFPPQIEQLIDFDDRAPLTSHDFHAQMLADSFEYGPNDRMYDRQGERRSMTMHPNMSSTYAQPKDLLYQHASTTASSFMPPTTLSDDMASGSYVYARPLPRGSRVRSLMGPMNPTDKYIRNSELELPENADNNRKLQAKEMRERGGAVAAVVLNGASRKKLPFYQHSSNERDTSDFSYESTTADDFVNVGHSERPASHKYAQRSPTQASKNQDGVGSFESWDYVFQNLERSGYSKDLGERGDLLVQSLDLDSLNLVNGTGNGAEKRRTTNADAEKAGGWQSTAQGEKSKTLEKTAVAAEKREFKAPKQEKSILKSQSASTSIKKIKSALKSTAATHVPIVSDNNNGNNNVAETDMRRSTRKTEAAASSKRPSMNTITRSCNSNSNSNSNTSSNINTNTNTNSNSNINIKSHNQSHSNSNKQAPVIPTQVVVSSPNEWSCRSCTYLNPDTKRICEMCSRSKDFNLDTVSTSASTSAAATAAAVVSNTPTCV